jgi:hypothetical protein
MRQLKPILFSAVVAAASHAAQAEELLVRLEGSFSIAPSTVARPFSIEFRVPDPLTGVSPESAEAFSLLAWPVTATLDGSVGTYTSRPAWFSYESISYAGFDLRMRDVLTPGDLYQMIVVTPEPLYSGPTSAPTLRLGSLDGLPGEICYYATGSGSCTATGSITNAIWSVSVVPEPAVWLLMSAGLSLLAAARLRRLGQAA